MSSHTQGEPTRSGETRAPCEPLTMGCVLDQLDDYTATYVGPNGARITVDRATYNGNGRPLTASIVLPPVWTDPNPGYSLGSAPRHTGFDWVRYGLPRKGEWYDDGGTFEEAVVDWMTYDGARAVNVYKPHAVASTSPYLSDDPDGNGPR